VFRRSLLAELEPGLVTVPELMGGWAALHGTVSQLAGMTGEPIEALIPVTDAERARSRELVEGDPDTFRLVNALALDPWNTDAQALLTRALTPAAPPPPPDLEGVRGFAVLAFADELVASPEMLSAYGGCFSGSDDVTLVVVGEQFEALAAALDAYGLAGEDGPDLLAVAPSQALAGSVQAVYSRDSQSGALASVPRVDDSRVALLRGLAAGDPAVVRP
jgi:hypothetical protein